MRIFDPSWTQSWTKSDNVAYGIAVSAIWLALLWFYQVPFEIAAVVTFVGILWLCAIRFFCRS
jgi:hypothetical protein